MIVSHMYFLWKGFVKHEGNESQKKGVMCVCVWEEGKTGEWRNGDGPEQEEGTFLLDYIRILVGNKWRKTRWSKKKSIKGCWDTIT